MGFQELSSLFIPYECSIVLSDTNLLTVAKSTEEASILIRQALSPAGKEAPQLGAVFDFATFAEIDVVLPLPRNLRAPCEWERVTMLHSISGANCDLGGLKSQLDFQQRQRPVVILVSIASACFGAFLPGALDQQEGGINTVDQEQRGLMFQLEPTLRVVGGWYGRGVQVELSATELRLSVSSGEGDGRMCLGKNGRVGSFTLSGGTGGRFADLDLQFEVDALNVVGY